jgi:hypothetical protein
MTRAKEVTMLKKLFFAPIGFFLVLPNDQLLAQGADVSLLLKNGQEISGELLSVRDSSLVISTMEDANENDLSTQTVGIIAVRNEELFHVVVKGKSNIVTGMAGGVLYGAALGGVLCSCIPAASGLSTPEERAAGGAFVFGAIGFVVGTIAGIASSSNDKLVEPRMNNDFSSLRPLARYPDKEPEFLQVIE